MGKELAQFSYVLDHHLERHFKDAAFDTDFFYIEKLNELKFSWYYGQRVFISLYWQGSTLYADDESDSEPIYTSALLLLNYKADGSVKIQA